VANYILKDPITESCGRFRTKLSEFRVVGKGASTLHNIMISTQNRYVHRVNVNFGE
jgi:hypothetical protein